MAHDYDDKIKKLEDQIAQRRAKLSDLKAVEAKQNRKDEARRKIIYGAAYLQALSTLDEDLRKRSLAKIETHITRPTDRVFLNLEPLEDQTPVDRVKDGGGPETSDLPFGN